MKETHASVLLIAEDDANLRTLLQAAAEQTRQFDVVHTVADGQEALDRVRHSAPEIAPTYILTDLSMPRCDGIELIRQLKRHEETKRIPIAVMTSSDRPNDREDAIAAGCCAFYHKPARFEELVRLISSLPKLNGENSVPKRASDPDGVRGKV